MWLDDGWCLHLFKRNAFFTVSYLFVYQSQVEMHAALLLDVQEFQKSLGAKHSVYDTTNRTGRSLKEKTSLADDNLKLDDMLSELRDKWDTICGKSVERWDAPDSRSLTLLDPWQLSRSWRSAGRVWNPEYTPPLPGECLLILDAPHTQCLPQRLCCSVLFTFKCPVHSKMTSFSKPPRISHATTAPAFGLVPRSAMVLLSPVSTSPVGLSS